MKKNLVIGIVSMVLTLSLAGCGGTSKYLIDTKYSKYVKLCDYKGVEASKVVFEVTDEDVKDRVQQDMYTYADYKEIKDRGVKKGDFVNITYETTVDGLDRENLSGKDVDILVGEGYIFDEVDKALEGMKTGDEEEVEVKLKDELTAGEDAGKDAVVKVKVNSITEENLPEYDDDFVKKNTEYKSVKEYEAALKEQIKEEKENQYKYITVDEIINYITTNSKFDGYPKALYEKCEKAYDKNNETAAQMYGMSEDEYLGTFGMDEDGKKMQIEQAVNSELVIGAIAQKENIDVTEEEVDKALEEQYKDYGYTSKEEFLKDYTREDVGYQLIYDKVADFLISNAKLKEVSEEDYLGGQSLDGQGLDSLTTDDGATIELDDLPTLDDSELPADFDPKKDGEDIDPTDLPDDFFDGADSSDLEDALNKK